MKNKKTLCIISAIAILVIFFLVSGCTGNITKEQSVQGANEEQMQKTEPKVENNSSNSNSLAQCLTEKGVKMYGTEWCGYCKKQKEAFGDSFKDIDYVNCDENKEECTSAGVRGYPTWLINGENFPGLKSLEDLASLSGCEI